MMVDKIVVYAGIGLVVVLLLIWWIWRKSD